MKRKEIMENASQAEIQKLFWHAKEFEHLTSAPQA